MEKNSKRKSNLPIFTVDDNWATRDQFGLPTPPTPNENSKFAFDDFESWLDKQQWIETDDSTLSACERAVAEKSCCITQCASSIKGNDFDATECNLEVLEKCDNQWVNPVQKNDFDSFFSRNAKECNLEQLEKIDSQWVNPVQKNDFDSFFGRNAKECNLEQLEKIDSQWVNPVQENDFDSFFGRNAKECNLEQLEKIDSQWVNPVQENDFDSFMSKRKATVLHTNLPNLPVTPAPDKLLYPPTFAQTRELVDSRTTSQVSSFAFLSEAVASTESDTMDVYLAKRKHAITPEACLDDLQAIVDNGLCMSTKKNVKFMFALSEEAKKWFQGDKPGPLLKQFDMAVLIANDKIIDKPVESENVRQFLRKETLKIDNFRWWKMSILQIIDCLAYCLNLYRWATQNFDRMQLLQEVSNCSEDRLWKLLMDLNPLDVVVCVNEFVKKLGVEGKNLYLYLGVTGQQQENDRMRYHKTKHIVVRTEVCIRNVNPDMAALAEFVGIHMLDEFANRQEIRGKININSGYDSVSFLKTPAQRSALYMYAAKELFKQPDRSVGLIKNRGCVAEEPKPNCFYNLHSKKNRISDTLNKMFEFCKSMNRENLSCKFCTTYKTRSKTMFKLHEMGSHNIINCVCNGCGTVGSLDQIIKHLEQKSVCVQKCDADNAVAGNDRIGKVKAETEKIKKCVRIDKKYDDIFGQWTGLKVIRAKEDPEKDGKNLPIRNAIEIESNYNMERYIPSKGNGYKFLVLLHKGDAERGIRGRPPLWYKPNAWVLLLLQPNPDSVKDDTLDMEKNTYDYYCTRKFVCAQSVPISHFIQVDVSVTKLVSKPDWFNLPMCTDKTGRNRVIVEAPDVQNNRAINLYKRGTHLSFPNYISDEVNGVVDVDKSVN